MNLVAGIRTRRTAFLVLLAWLFTVGAQVASACTSGPEEGHTESAGTAAAVRYHAATPADHAVGLQLAAAACFEVCGEASPSAAAPEREAGPLDQGPASAAAGAWPRKRAAAARVHLRAVPAGPPPRLSYSRLAL